MKTFEIGKTYTHGWIGDSDLFTSWTVIARTAKTITIKCIGTNEVKKCRVIKYLTEINNAETLMPFGNYSMCPLLEAK